MGEPADEGQPPHRRRPRYRGTHPTHFNDKYKELAPERYPETIAHLRERGQTPAGHHVPILVDEAVAVLRLAGGMRGVDATVGWGGHARRFLEKIEPGGQLLALDVDPIELPKTEARLRALGFGEDRLAVRRSNFAGLQAAMAEHGWSDGADFVFADLGVSSMQIDDPSRGFSFKVDGPLDLRMNPTRGQPASAWLERASQDHLASVLRDNADEPQAEAIAELLTERRGDLRTTQALAAAVRAAVAAGAAADDVELSVRRVFQAIRIAVNDELGALDMLLRQLPQCLRPGGRAALLTFHSGEDRRVKKAFAGGERDGVYAAVSDALVRPSLDEQRSNSRARSAKLRWAERSVRSAFHPAPTPWG